MLVRPRFTAALLLASSLAAHAAPTVQTFSVQDLVRLQRIADIQASPDGSRVAYTLRTTDIDANLGRTGIWLLDTRKGAPPAQRIAYSSANDTAAEWSGDGRFIYFLSTRSGSAQVWRVSPGGQDTLQVTNLPLPVGSFRVSPAGDRILVSLGVFIDCPELACTAKRLDAAAKSLAGGVLYTRLFVRHWDAWNDGRRSQLFSIELDEHGVASKTPVNLSGGLDGDVPSKPQGGREAYAFSPDGSQVVFSVRVAANAEPWSTNFDIYAVAASGGVLRNLTAENPAWDGQPAFAPDGSQLAYVATDRPGFESDRFHLVLMNVKTGVKRTLTQNWDRSIVNFAWSRDGKTLLATAAHLGQLPLWSVDVLTGRASALTGAGDVESYSVSGDKIFYTLSNLGSPADLYSVGFDGGKATQLTHLNQSLLAQRKLGEYEQFSFAGWHDENVFGYIVKPADFKRADAKRGIKYPVALLVHGGPHGAFGNEWHYRWNAETFAAAGYGVVLIDFHGSRGYGQAFSDSINGDWGGKPLEDLKTGLDAALKQYPWLDGSRMCALGGSYGGYMINWIAGAWPDRFKCLVSHSGTFDNRSMYYSTEELWFPEAEFGAAEYENPAAYAKHNPIDLVKNWKTPMLVIHGQSDFRVPYAQGLAAFTALQRRGIPSEFLYYPDENHWILKPAASVLWYDTTIAWLNRWTLN